jgi:hypothetical protein
MLDPDLMPEDDGWKPICDDPESQKEGLPEECKQCQNNCSNCPMLTPDDIELLDNLFAGMTQEEIDEWCRKEVGDDEIPF